MVENKVSRRYAKSLLLLAKERGELDQIYDLVLKLQNVADESREFRAVLRSPVIRKDKKLSIFRELFDSKVNPMWDGFLSIITHNNREKLLVEIAQAFKDLYLEEKNIIQATITTAVPLKGALEDDIKGMMEGLKAKDIQVEEVVNEDILGGLIIRVGDRQVDASIQRRLRDIERELVKEEYRVKL